jgi:hypothetical protein
MSDKSAYDALLWELCVNFGFCGCIKDGRPLHVDRFVPSTGPVTADQFVEWVFLADDMNPNSEPKRWSSLKDKIKGAFIRHMGDSTVDATQFRFGDDRDDSTRSARGEIYKTIEVWQRISADHVLLYTCLQYVKTGEFCLVSVERIDPGAPVRDEARRKVLTQIVEGRDRYEWCSTIEGAIAANERTLEAKGTKLRGTIESAIATRAAKTSGEEQA